MDVEIWSDVVCPWCYLGKVQFEAALDSFEHRDDVAVIYRSFELDPAAPRDVSTPTVERLAHKYGMSTAEAAAAQQQMQQRAAQLGLEFRLDDLRSGNTRAAHRVTHLAKSRGRQPEMVERLHRAYFTEQRSVFDDESLADLARDIGLDGAEATTVIEGDAYTADVEADEAMARSIGVSGVPFFVLDRRYAISGAQPAQVIGSALQQAWTEAVRSNA